MGKGACSVNQGPGSIPGTLIKVERKKEAAAQSCPLTSTGVADAPPSCMRAAVHIYTNCKCCLNPGRVGKGGIAYLK